MNSEDLPLGVRRAMLREPALKQPVARTRQMPITEPETGLERVEGVNSTNVAAATGGALNAKNENYDHHIDSPLPNSKPQRDQAPALGRSNEGETQGVRRPVVRFVGYRVRPLDPDNFAGSVKDLLDGLRHSGLLQGDEHWRIALETEQVKVRSFKDERTEITICYPDL